MWDSFEQDIKVSLATEYFGLFDQTYFEEDSSEPTEALNNIYTLVKKLVKTHDQLAEDTGNAELRINDKRGRKAEAKKLPTTVDDILNTL